MNLGAVILCGGESRRMGQPKAWLPFGPERMLQHVVRLVSTVTDQVVVVAAPGQDLPPLPVSVAVAHDPVGDWDRCRGWPPAWLPSGIRSSWRMPRPPMRPSSSRAGSADSSP